MARNSSLRAGLVLALAAWSLIGCGGQGLPLAGDQQSASKCPPGGCANPEPDRTQLFLGGPGGTYAAYKPQYSGSTIIDQIEFGGPCYASTYPSNRVEVTLKDAGGTVLGASDIVSTNGATPKCVNGRYGVSLNGARFPAGSSYKVSIQIIGIDANGNAFDNAGGGGFTIPVNRY